MKLFALHISYRNRTGQKHADPDPKPWNQPCVISKNLGYKVRMTSDERERLMRRFALVNKMPFYSVPAAIEKLLRGHCGEGMAARLNWQLDRQVKQTSDT